MIIKNDREQNIFNLRNHKIEIFYGENRTIGFSATYRLWDKGQPLPSIFVSKDESYDYMYFDGISAKNFLYILNKIYDEEKNKNI